MAEGSYQVRSGVASGQPLEKCQYGVGSLSVAYPEGKERGKQPQHRARTEVQLCSALPSHVTLEKSLPIFTRKSAWMVF